MSLDNLPQTQEDPKPSDNTTRDTGERTLSLLQKIQAGTVDPKCIRPAERRLIVNYLMADGYSTADMAQILKISDRSIERDKKAIREKNAISQDPELVSIIAGRLVDEAQICIQKIRKCERDSNCPPAAKIEGEKGCFQIINNLAERLQSMGYLPTAAKKLEADLTHHMENTFSLDEIKSEAQRLQNIEISLPAKKTKKVESRTVKQNGK